MPHIGLAYCRMHRSERPLLTIGLRVAEEEEREGLDVALHGEHVE